MSKCRQVCAAVIRILLATGYKIDGNNADHDDILAALSNYEEKFDSMKEHILMQKSV